MELKVWVDGIQRVVCGVTQATTCQDVVFALAHATNTTGRFTLIERWRSNERLLAPNQHPLKVLMKWGEHASDVQFILQRTALESSCITTKNSPSPQKLTHINYNTQHLSKDERAINNCIKPANNNEYLNASGNSSSNVSKGRRCMSPPFNQTGGSRDIRKSLTFSGGAFGRCDVEGESKSNRDRSKGALCSNIASSSPFNSQVGLYFSNSVNYHHVRQSQQDQHFVEALGVSVNYPSTNGFSLSDSLNSSARHQLLLHSQEHSFDSTSDTLNHNSRNELVSHLCLPIEQRFVGKHVHVRRNVHDHLFKHYGSYAMNEVPPQGGDLSNNVRNLSQLSYDPNISPTKRYQLSSSFSRPLAPPSYEEVRGDPPAPMTPGGSLRGKRQCVSPANMAVHHLRQNSACNLLGDRTKTRREGTMSTPDLRLPSNTSAEHSQILKSTMDSSNIIGGQYASSHSNIPPQFARPPPYEVAVSGAGGTSHVPVSHSAVGGAGCRAAGPPRVLPPYRPPPSPTSRLTPTAGFQPSNNSVDVMLDNKPLRINSNVARMSLENNLSHLPSKFIEKESQNGRTSENRADALFDLNSPSMKHTTSSSEMLSDFGHISSELINPVNRLARASKFNALVVRHSERSCSNNNSLSQRTCKSPSDHDYVNSCISSNIRGNNCSVSLPKQNSAFRVVSAYNGPVCSNISQPPSVSNSRRCEKSPSFDDVGYSSMLVDVGKSIEFDSPKQTADSSLDNCNSSCQIGESEREAHSDTPYGRIGVRLQHKANNSPNNYRKCSNSSLCVSTNTSLEFENSPCDECSEQILPTSSPDLVNEKEGCALQSNELSSSRKKVRSEALEPETLRGAPSADLDKATTSSSSLLSRPALNDVRGASMFNRLPSSSSQENTQIPLHKTEVFPDKDSTQQCDSNSIAMQQDQQEWTGNLPTNNSAPLVAVDQQTLALGRQMEHVVLDGIHRDLVSLVNLQRDKITGQQIQLTKCEAEIAYIEGRCREDQAKLEYANAEMERLSRIIQQLELEAPEDDLIQQEQELSEAMSAQHSVTEQLSDLQQQLRQCDANMVMLHRSISALEEELASLKKGQAESSSEDVPDALRAYTLADVPHTGSSDASQVGSSTDALQLHCSTDDSDIGSSTHQTDPAAYDAIELEKKLKELDSTLAGKREQVEQLKKAMMSENLEALSLMPPDTRATASRPAASCIGSGRKMLGSPRMLETAVPTSKNPHGVWV